jgi:hypothetical protein
VPTTIVGLVILVVLLLPGMTYRVSRDAQDPTPGHSAFRETAAIVTVSALAHGVTLAGFAIARTWGPTSITPDIGQLLRPKSGYFGDHYARVFLWAAGLMLLSCALSALAGAWRPGALMKRLPSAQVDFRSAWWKQLRAGQPAGHTIYLGCELDDGSYVSGELLSFATGTEETADRDLVLTGDLGYRPPGSNEPQEFNLGASTLIVSARRIKFITVNYAPKASGTE